jgi:hypothetical protein
MLPQQQRQQDQQQGQPLPLVAGHETGKLQCNTFKFELVPACRNCSDVRLQPDLVNHAS